VAGVALRPNDGGTKYPVMFRATRTIRMLGEEYLKNSIDVGSSRGPWRCISRLNAHIPTRQVRAMTAVDLWCGQDGTDPRMTRLPLFGTKIRIAGFGGLRLREQNALCAIDVLRPGLRPRQRPVDQPAQPGGAPRPGEEPHPPRGAAT
jgi:hypothetical protein